MSKVWDVIQSAESNTKCVLMYIMLLKDGSKENLFNISVESMCDALGLGKGQVYRAQSQLKKYGLLKITPTYSKVTGKKEFDTYEFIG